MDSGMASTKPLTKEETKILLSYIENSKIIYNKTTNATTNKLKTEEWQRIAAQFNAVVTSAYRTPQQLRLKWENLKKNSRKRKTQIRINNIKTGGGGPDFIPPDDVLDRVADLLGSTVEGLPVHCGGDANPIMEYNTQELHISTPNEVEVEVEVENINNIPTCSTSPPINKVLVAPRASALKRKNIKSNDHRAARNEAIAKYYNTKTKMLEAQYENVILENQKLKLEIEKLNNKE